MTPIALSEHARSAPGEELNACTGIRAATETMVKGAVSLQIDNISLQHDSSALSDLGRLVFIRVLGYIATYWTTLSGCPGRTMYSEAFLIPAVCSVMSSTRGNLYQYIKPNVSQAKSGRNSALDTRKCR